MSGLPKGWAKCRLSDISEIVTGKTPSKKLEANFGGEIPFIKPGDVTNQGVIIDTDESLSELGATTVPTIPAGSITVTCIGNLGRTAITKCLSATNQQINSVVPEKDIDTKYLYYYLQTMKVWMEAASSSTTVAIINKTRFSAAPIILAPLNEQIRIANKLDSILAKVDKAQARLDKIPAILKRFRQSVLAAATSGELNGPNVTSDDWTSVKLMDVVETKPRNGKSPKGVDFDTGVKNLTLSAITPGYFVENKFKFVDLDVPSDSHLWVKNQDILIQRANSIEYVGVSALYEGEDDQYIYPDLIMKCRANERILSKYLYYALSSEPVRKYFRDNATGTTGNMPKINQTVVSAAPISLPPLAEQEDIVSLVEKLFRKADTVEKQYLDAKARLDRLTQSILAKAFRGELVPQDPTDEPAEKLLERIWAEKEQSKPKKTTRKSTTKAKTAEKE
ncbi:restriction endonuclease subunit S [Vibrio fluvialis]|nr:restriction endonuclease subunit S [Vibrio fluvialis]